MERSLAAADSGINAQQTYLDSIGNNIANSSTDGYKQQDVLFSDLLTQRVNGATAPVPPAVGGVNPSYVGSGVEVASITQNNSEGAIRQTGVASNAAIQGNGYFVVNQNGQQVYTRAGDFNLDSNGDLVTPSGGLVQSTAGAPIQIKMGSAGPKGGTLTSYSIGSDGVITGTYSNGTTAPIDTIALATFPNAQGLNDVGNNYYTVSANSGAATIGAPGAGAAGTLQGGAVESSNVNLAQQLTDLVSAQSNYEANTKVVSTTAQVLQSLVQMA